MMKNYISFKTCTLLIVALLISISGFGQSTPYTVSMDGGTNNATAFGGEGTIATSVATFYTHWDATYLYLGWSAGRTNYSSDMYYIAIDTNPNASSGTSNAIEGVGFTTGNRLPDYYVVFENNSSFYGIPATNGNAIEVYNGTSGSWNFQSRTDGNDTVNSRVNFQDSPNGEVRLRISWSALNFTPGNNKAIGLTYWTNTPNGDFMWSRFPNDNPATGNTPKTLTHQMIFNSTGSGLNPSAIAYSNPFSENTKYASNTNGNWNNANSWIRRGIPTNGGDVTINHDLTLDVNANVNRTTVNAGSSLTINTGNALTTTNAVDGLTINSTSTTYGSLISDGTITGTVNYNRHINNAAGTGSSTTANDLVSPPLDGMTFGDLRMANSNILSGTIMGSGPFYLFGPFDNSSANEYVLFEDTVDDGISINPGVGYRTGSTDGGTYTFTGTVETGNVMETITTPSGGGNKWNLIGNPYPSYITLSEFLSINNSKFDDSAAAVYGYDGAATDGWTIWNLLYCAIDPNAVITPGQGFFVASASASEVVNFNTNMRTKGTTDDFIPMRSSSPITTVKLNMSSSDKTYNTEVYFTEFSTLGLDPGYDASLFGGTIPGFSVYSNLVEENNGVPLGIQAVGETDYNDVTIPLGVSANQAEQITFSLIASTIPSTVEVYLDDTVANTSTLLTNSNYVLTPATNISGVGRFFLRFIDNSLSIAQNNFDNLDVFMSSKSKEIVINGQLLANTSCTLYDIQGRLISTFVLDDAILQNRINVSNVNNGIYVINLLHSDSILSKKIIIE